MNLQQAMGLIAVCAVLMIPLGIGLALFHQSLHRWLQPWLPPRHLRRVGERRRRSTRRGGAA